MSADLSVVIPARDEAEMLPSLLADLRRVSLHLQIIVVDDHSRDGTWDVARDWGALALRNPLLPGYGHTIQTGLCAATAPRVTILTADGSDSLATLSIYAARSGLVFGNRWEHTTPIGYPRGKRILNRIGNSWIGDRLAYRYGWPFYDDWTDPFKAYPIAIAHACLDRPLPNDMSAGLALAVRAARRASFRVVPTAWQGRTAGRSKWRWREPIGYLRTAWEECR